MVLCGEVCGECTDITVSRKRPSMGMERRRSIPNRLAGSRVRLRVAVGVAVRKGVIARDV